MELLSPHIYQSPFSTISFYLSEKEGLYVEIKIKDLLLRSIKESDIPNYVALFGNREIVSKHMRGEPRSPKEVEKWVKDNWIKRWQNNDPYSAFAIFIGGEFAGSAILGHGSGPGEAQVTGFGWPKYRGRKYGKQAAIALINDYALATVKEGYLLEGKPLQTIRATARLDNPVTIAICEKLNMICERNFIKEYTPNELQYSLHIEI